MKCLKFFISCCFLSLSCMFCPNILLPFALNSLYVWRETFQHYLCWLPSVFLLFFERCLYFKKRLSHVLSHINSILVFLRHRLTWEFSILKKVWMDFILKQKCPHIIKPTYSTFKKLIHMLWKVNYAHLFCLLLLENLVLLLKINKCIIK